MKFKSFVAIILSAVILLGCSQKTESQKYEESVDLMVENYPVSLSKQYTLRDMLEIFGDLEVTIDTSVYVVDDNGYIVVDTDGNYVEEYKLLEKVDLPSTSTDEDIQRINDLYVSISDKYTSSVDLTVGKSLNNGMEIKFWRDSVNEYGIPTEKIALDNTVTGIALFTENKDFSSVKLRGVPVNTITKSRELCTIFSELRGYNFYDDENFLSVARGIDSIIINYNTGYMRVSFNMLIRK